MTTTKDFEELLSAGVLNNEDYPDTHITHYPERDLPWVIEDQGELLSAASTLNQAVKIVETLVEKKPSTDKFWVVINLDEKYGTAASKLHRHFALHAAVEEARRLSRGGDGATFAVMQLTAVVRNATFWSVP